MLEVKKKSEKSSAYPFEIPCDHRHFAAVTANDRYKNILIDARILILTMQMNVAIHITNSRFRFEPAES